MPKFFLIGYMPLFDYSKLSPGSLTEFNGDIVNGWLSEVQPQLVAGVLWVSDGDTPYPVFLMDRATEVANHLVAWMAGDTDRFTIHIDQRGDGYAMLLLPDVNKSINRWKVARLAYYEEFVEGNDFSVFYIPLGVYCPSSVGYKLAVGDKKLEELYLGFLDVDKLDHDNPANSDFSGIVKTGPFKLGLNDDKALLHLDNLFGDQHEIA